jgi:CRP/FNR family cyclic AMP-dependent transcriptional regulator
MGQANYAQYAERIPLFRGLTSEEVADILNRGQMRNYPQGKTIFERGTRGNMLYIVFSGIVDIFAGEFPIAQCNVGDAFGEMSAIDHRPHTATAIAGTDVLVFTLAESELAAILKQHVAVRLLLNVIHLLSGHLADTNSHIAAMESKLSRIERTRTPVRHED